jgi:predicted DNA-binding transcriptional regulator YafY
MRAFRPTERGVTWSSVDHFEREDPIVRADRLVATLLLLQSRGRVTAAEVADELEVSVKTARRDLEALAIAGIPVYSQAGRNGGWSLVGGARTDLSGLTADEARALFLLAGPSAALTPDAKAALRKLVAALPETFRSAAEAAAAAIVLDPANWGDHHPAPPPPHLEALQRAVIDGIQVRLGYADRARTRTERLVHPLGLVEKGSVWYLVAGTDAGMRTFRLSRIESVDVTGEPVVRPSDFDLAATWRQTVAAIEERRTSVRAIVRCDPGAVHALRSQFGTGFKVVRDHLADGRVEVEIGMAYPNRIAEQLAGWGDHVEVVDPPEVRDLLARIGAQLVARYA